MRTQGVDVRSAATGDGTAESWSRSDARQRTNPLRDANLKPSVTLCTEGFFTPNALKGMRTQGVDVRSAATGDGTAESWSRSDARQRTNPLRDANFKVHREWHGLKSPKSSIHASSIGFIF